MTGQRALAAVLFVVAVGVGVLAASIGLGAIGGPSSASPNPLPSSSGIAIASPSAGQASPSASASAPPSASPSPPPSKAPATPPPTATPKPTTTPGRPASISFAALKLDATSDPAGKDRVLTFRTQGSGSVHATIKLDSPQGQVVACLRTTKKDFGCKTTAGGELTEPTTAKQAEFTLTLRGDGIDAPVVDIALEFPSASPSVTIEHARFDGTAFPDTNGIQATVVPSRDGDVHLVAAWGGHPLEYEVDLIEVGGPGVHSLPNQGPAPGTDVKLGVVAPNPWRLVLQNIETGFGVTDLTATIAWP
jgi:hypothetical protein